jgi:hypothetical protein
MKACHWVRYAAAVAALWTLGNLPCPAWAEEAANGNAAAPEADAAKKPAGKDPTAGAFALPGGVKLNPKQQAAYDQLKADKQPELQQAIDDLQNSKSGATAKAAKKVRDLRGEIRNSINDIIYSHSYASSGSDSGGNGADSSGPSYGYAIPYGGYYPYWPYGGYYRYPYYHYPRPTNGTSGDRKLPPRPPASRPAGRAASSAKR